MHVPVLLERCLEALDLKAQENVIDCTIGGGGHAKAILERTGPKGKVLGIDQDPQAIDRLKSLAKQAQGRLILVQGNFAEIDEIAGANKFKPVHGILFDLGLSSDQLEQSGRGFSFQKKEPLDMRMNPENPVSAEKIVNFWSKLDLERTLKEYGEEQYARSIAEAIVKSRAQKQITTTAELAELIIRAAPRTYQTKEIHPATKTFQALRIAVNNELENLKTALPRAADLLEPGGRIAVISFHSLEDRIVKEFFKNNSQLQLLSKKPSTASEQEIKKNPRSRSAKLRAAIKQKQ